MAKSPDQPREPDKSRNMVKRDPAKHSKKDPAKPTRAKASLPDQPPAELLNPGIGQGTTGPGSQTGLEPPPDNSFDRGAGFSAAHRARTSIR